jgi:hypothetical protein
MNTKNKRNMVPQFIKQEDGTTKTIFHEKTMPKGSYKQVWDALNKQPKENSKRQKMLRAKAAK